MKNKNKNPPKKPKKPKKMSMQQLRKFNGGRPESCFIDVMYKAVEGAHPTASTNKFGY
jgi:hypothetical protein